MKKIRNKLNNLKKDSKNQNKNQNIDKINENEINNVNIEFKSKQKDVFNIFGAKKAKQNGESWRRNYGKHPKEIGLFSKRTSEKISLLNKRKETFFEEVKNKKNKTKYKFLNNLFNNLNNIFNTLKNKILGKIESIKNKYENLDLDFDYDKLLATFQVCNNFKEIYDKINSKEFLNNGDDFLKNLYNKYRVILENENLIEKILEDANSNKIIPPTYSDTKICKNTNNFRTFLANRGIKSNNTPFEIKIMLDFIPFMYNIFCLLGYVNEIGEITNDDAKKDMETVMDKIKDTKNLYINYLNKNKNTKIKFEITENNNFNNSPKSNQVEKPIDLNLQNLNFLNNTTKNETAKPNENEINENNNFNINFNLYDLNQPKEQEEQKEQKEQEELEEDLNSSSRDFF